VEKKKRGKRGEGCIYRVKGSANWYLKYYVNGKPCVEATGSPDRKIAENILKGRMAKKTLGLLVPGAEKVTFDKMKVDILNDYKINGKKSIIRLENSLHNLTEFFGGDKAQVITTDRIKGYARERQAEGAENGTINRELSALKRMFNLAIQAGNLSHRPHIPMLKENAARTGFFEPGDFIALRNALPDYLQPVVTFAYYTGWRKQEILHLKWNQVDLQEKIIRLNPDQTKTGAGRVIALDGELLNVMQTQCENRRVVHILGQSPTLICAHVFHHDGKPIKDFRAAWDNAVRKVGLSGRIFHDFRRSAIRNMTRAGVPERIAMAISGHKTRSVFDRYDIVSEEDLREAARKTSERLSLKQTATVIPSAQAAVSKKQVS
jgi:integrase